MGVKKEIDSRFEKFGTVGFTATTKVNDFIERLESGNVSGTRCRDCGLVFFPPRADCWQCLSNNVQWFDVAGTGKLITYSRLQFAPVGFQDDVPYCIAILDYGDYKVFGRIDTDIPEEELEIGMEMITVANPLPNGKLNYVFKKK